MGSLRMPRTDSGQVGVLTVVFPCPAGAFITQVMPVMWLGHSLLCMVMLVTSFGMMGLHLTAYLQDPGYTPLPDAGEAQGAKPACAAVALACGPT